MKKDKIFFLLTFLFLLTLLNISSAQNYEIELINKTPLYATASILQDYENDGDLDIIITRRDATTDKEPSSVEWLENDGTGQFPRNTLFADLDFPVDLDTGDFNKDGNIDYVISDRFVSINSGALLLYLKQSDGSYTKEIIDDSIRTDQSVVADFDKDGNLDIVSVGFNRSAVSIYWNDGNLNFTKQTIADSVIQVQLIESNDIDNDGDEDIIYGGGGLSGFRLLYNNGNGVFDSSRTLYMNNGQYSNAKRGMTIADVNNDEIKDILAFSGVGFGGMYFLDGSDNFSSSIIDIDGIDLGGDIVVEDIDDNGLNDIIRQNSGDDYLSILYQDSEMDFRVEFLELNWDNQGPGQMSLGDLDNDGDTDLVFAENGNVDGDMTWFENIEGMLYRHHLYSEIEAVRIPQINDIDNDGDLDIVVTAGDDGVKTEEDEIVWYENRGENTFIEHRIDDNISFPGDIDLGDLDGDENVDIIATAHDDSSLIWYKKNGPDWFKIVIDENLVMPLGCAVGSIDSDEALDIVVCSSGENKVLWYKNNGSGVFSRNELDANLPEPQNIKIGDFNNDGNSDIVVVTLDTNNTVVFYLNNGNETFTKTTLASGQKSFALEFGDWDGNETIDIVVGFDKGSVLGEEQRDIAVFLNDGNANFTDSTLVVLQERTNTIKLVDTDNDNDLDIIFGAGNAGIFPLRMALNNNGSVETVNEITDNAVRVYGIDAGDINEDGIIDIVASNQVNANNNLLLLVGGMSTNVLESNNEFLPSKIQLYQNYPNPFNPETTIKFDIKNTNNVSLIVYNLLGQKVKILTNEQLSSGSYTVKWDGKSDSGELVPSGMYILQMISNGNQLSKKMVMLK